MSTFNFTDSVSESGAFPFETKKTIEKIENNSDTFEDLAENLKTQMVLHELDTYFKSKLFKKIPQFFFNL
jgi:hypothetical protein